MPGSVPRNECLDMSGFEDVLLADDPQLLPVAVVGEGLDHVGARVHELAVEFLDHIRVVQDDLGDERTRLKVSSPLAFEQVAFGADHGTALEQCGQIRHVALLARDPAVQSGVLPPYSKGYAPPELAAAAGTARDLCHDNLAGTAPGQRPSDRVWADRIWADGPHAGMGRREPAVRVAVAARSPHAARRRYP
jgi:hypothetical protein